MATSGDISQETFSDTAHVSDHATLFIPRISIFSGNSKGATTYDMWRYEVCCLQRDYNDSVIQQAIRRSVRGEASKIILCLGLDTTVQDILLKFDSVFGDVERKETLLADFYSARQQPNESVADWGCRLEDLLGKVDRINTINSNQRDEMLRNVFWHGLRPSLQHISGHKYDNLTSFDSLLVAIRQLEFNESRHKTMTISNSAVQIKLKPRKSKTPSTSEQPQQSQVIHELQQAIKELTSRLQQLQEQQSRNHSMAQQDTTNDNYTYDDTGPVCYRCGQIGHIAVGCRVILDHRRKTHTMSHVSYNRDYTYPIRARSYAMTEEVGDSNEMMLDIHGRRCKALLDTGSTVSTLSHSFYQDHLSHLPLEPLNTALQIECADGSSLPYLGYIKVDIDVDGVSSRQTLPECCFLIVNDTHYNRNVPALIGTNILTCLMNRTKDIHGIRFLQDANLHTPWYLAFRCLSLRKKNLPRTSIDCH